MKIKNIMMVSLVILLAACVSSEKTPESFQVKNFKQRTLAAQTSLEGTYLAVADYINHDRNPAVRIYLDEIESEPGSYYAVLLEYANLLKVFPKYVASNKFEDLSEEIGFLNHIVEKIWLYKVVPSNTSGHYAMLELKANTRNIEAVPSENPRQLILSKEAGLSHPLENAIISPSKTGHAKKIFFPNPSSRSIKYGKEYSIAHLVYGRIGLDSTWRDEFLSGPYFSAYGKKDDVVLRLSQSEDALQANFEVNPKYRYKDLSRGQIKKREEVFTNPKSAFLEGGFVLREPVEGMFVFSPMFSNTSEETREEISGRVGVFIDIFDATKKLNQDVVELIIVNTEDPLDFHMHYEDPDNGNGEEFNKSGER